MIVTKIVNFDESLLSKSFLQYLVVVVVYSDTWRLLRTLLESDRVCSILIWMGIIVGDVSREALLVLRRDDDVTNRCHA